MCNETAYDGRLVINTVFALRQSGTKKPLYLAFADVIKASIQTVEIFQTRKTLLSLEFLS